MDDLISRLFNTSEPLVRMRNAPAYKDWAAGLTTLAEQPELACLREPLLGLAMNGFATPAPIVDFMDTHLSSMRARDLWLAADRIEQSIPVNACSALLAAAVALSVWSARLGKDLYSQESGMPPEGWAQFPYVCASAALKARAIDEALRLVERSLDVLRAAKYKDDPRLMAVIDRYRKLGVMIETRWRSAIDDLAGDLRDSCKAQQPNFRAEIGALLWTLGMLPESTLLESSSGSQELPPLRLCSHLIHMSNMGIQHDPLTQYIWLEMKDREPFSLREHPVFFGLVNLRFHNNLLDDVMPTPPSRLYAKTIIGWFRGDLNSDLALEYVDAYRLVEQQFPNDIDWPIYFRMRLLAWMVGVKFGFLADPSDESRREMLLTLSRQSADMHKQAFLKPALPELYTRAAGPLFSLLDNLQVTGTATEELLEQLEGFRLGNMHYWLACAPPLPSSEEAVAAAPLLEREKQLLQELRGAYFLLLSPILPMHYQRATRNLDPDDPESMQYPDTRKGPEYYRQIRKSLDDLYAEMQTVAPEYASRRTSPAATTKTLATALNAHRPTANAAQAVGNRK